MEPGNHSHLISPGLGKHREFVGPILGGALVQISDFPTSAVVSHNLIFLSPLLFTVLFPQLACHYIGHGGAAVGSGMNTYTLSAKDYNLSSYSSLCRGFYW